MMRRSPAPATYFFTENEHRILKAVSAKMIGVPCDTALDTPIVVIDTFVRTLPKALQRQLRIGLHLFQWGPVLFMRRLAKFTDLPSDAAVAYIESWAASRYAVRRKLFRGLRDIALLGYYSTAEPEIE